MQKEKNTSFEVCCNSRTGRTNSLINWINRFAIITATATVERAGIFQRFAQQNRNPCRLPQISRQFAPFVCQPSTSRATNVFLKRSGALQAGGKFHCWVYREIIGLEGLLSLTEKRWCNRKKVMNGDMTLSQNQLLFGLFSTWSVLSGAFLPNNIGAAWEYHFHEPVSSQFCC